MGEIADMMLDGTLCECCGEFIGSDAGYPQYCSPECAADRGVVLDDGVLLPKTDKALRTCPLCQKTLKSVAGLGQHMRDKHGDIEASCRSIADSAESLKADWEDKEVKL